MPAVSVGDVVEGVVDKITAFGAFVKLDSGDKALIHVSEIANTYVKKVEDFLQIGARVKAEVIKIDEKGRIDLSLKRLQMAKSPVAPKESFEDMLAKYKKDSDQKLAVFEPKVSRVKKSFGKKDWE